MKLSLFALLPFVSALQTGQLLNQADHSNQVSVSRDEPAPILGTSSAQEPTTGGDHVVEDWQVYAHQSFPRYSIRSRSTVKLCDPNVNQVSMCIMNV